MFQAQDTGDTWMKMLSNPRNLSNVVKSYAANMKHQCKSFVSKTESFCCIDSIASQMVLPSLDLAFMP